MQFTNTATLINTAPSGTEEWHKARRGGIGGSDIAAILGLSKWTSYYTLWAKKTGRLLDNETSEVMEWGNRLEPVIIDKFAENHPELQIIRDVGTWSNNYKPFMIANPDGIYKTETNEYGVLEIKTAMYEEDWRDGVPKYYETQVQWYMQVLGLLQGRIAVLFHGNKYQEYEIYYDRFEGEVAREAAEEFRAWVASDEAPEFDGSNSTFETVRKLHPEIDGTEVEVGHLYEEYLRALKVHDTAVYELTEQKTRILHEMDKAKYGLVLGDRVFTRQARNGGTPYLQARAK